MALFENHVSVTFDIATMLDFNPAGTLAIHDHLVVKAPPPVPPVPEPKGISMEIPVPLIWPPGLALGSHKFTSTVYHHQTWIALEKHDCGPMIVHISLCAGVDLLMPLHILTSTRKAKFRAGEVKADGKAIACCTMLVDVPAVTPMEVCGAVKMPWAGTGSALAASMIVGMHWIDMAMGIADVVITFMTGAIKSGSFSQEAFSPFSTDARPNAGSLVAAAIGLAGQAFFGYHGDVSASYNPLGGFVRRGGVSITRDGSTGTVRTAVDFRLGTSRANVNVHGHGDWHDFDYENPRSTDREVQLRGGGSILGYDFGGQVDGGTGEAGEDGFAGSGIADNPAEEPPSFPTTEGDTFPSWEDLPEL